MELVEDMISEWGMTIDDWDAMTTTQKAHVYVANNKIVCLYNILSTHTSMYPQPYRIKPAWKIT
jgi:hypothetical protein